MVFAESRMDDERTVMILILRELIKRAKYGGAHTPLDNITHSLPDNFLHNKQGIKTIEKAVKLLVNQEWILVLNKRTGKGSDLHVSINPRKIKEINEFLYQ